MDHQQHTQMGYHPDFLTTNFWMQECQKSHKKRLKTMKPYIDSRTNNVMNMPHLKSRLKKQMNDRHERDRIQHENRILLNRLSHVMRTKQVDDRHRKEFTSDVHRKTLAIKRQFKWNRIARENERMGQRIANAKSAYSRKKLKAKRKKEQATPAANSRLVMPWTLGKGIGRVTRTANWNKNMKKSKRDKQRTARTGVANDGTRMMPSITSGFDQSPQSAKAPFMTMDRMRATMPSLRTAQSADSLYNTSLMSATTSRSERSTFATQSRAMAAWEEIKSWSLWDMPLQPRKHIRDVDLRLTKPMGEPRAATVAQLEATMAPSSPSAATLPPKAGVAYNRNDRFTTKARTKAITKPSHGARFLGSDVQLLRETRKLNDGAVWALRAVEVGTTTNLQDDAMAGFRIDGQQEGGGPALSFELSVDDVKELAENWNDNIVSATLKRCKRVGKGGQLYQRFTSMKVTDIGHKVTAAQWEEESNRARYIRRRVGKFLLDRVLATVDGDLLRLDMDWGVEEDDDDTDRLTWQSVDQSTIRPDDSETATGAEGEGTTVINDEVGGEPHGTADDPDAFVVVVSLMRAETGDPVQGAEVKVMRVSGETVSVAASDGAGHARLECSYPAWRAEAMKVVAAGGGVRGETGLLWPEDSSTIDCMVLMDSGGNADDPGLVDGALEPSFDISNP